MSNTRKATGARKSAPVKNTPPETPPAMVDLDALLGEDARPERVVPLCLRGHLQAEWDRLKEAYERGPGDDDQALMHERATKRRVAEQMAKVEQEMRAGTVEFRLRALPRRRTPGTPADQVVWQELVEQHPPRKDPAGKVDQRDAAAGVNTATFFEALVRASVVEPEMSPERWEALDARLSSAQFDALATTAWQLNRSEVDIPFSRAAWTMRRLDAGSRRRSGSASPSNDTRDGNPESSPSTNTTKTGG